MNGMPAYPCGALGHASYRAPAAARRYVDWGCGKKGRRQAWQCSPREVTSARTLVAESSEAFRSC